MAAKIVRARLLSCAASSQHADKPLLRTASSLATGTVIVHILAAVLRRLSGLSQPSANGASSSSSSSSTPSSSTSQLPPIPTVYIACESPFATLEDFIRDSQRRYNLDLYTVRGGMKEGLIEYFEGGGDQGVPGSEAKQRETTSSKRDRRDVKAIFIGTRRTDPNGGKAKRLR